VIFAQDLKFRAIHMTLPIAVLALGLFIYFKNEHHYMGLVYNLLFLMITFLGLYIYLSLKKRDFKNPFKEAMGMGDILFFIAVVPLFSTHNYILFFITGMIFSIIGFMIIRMFVKTEYVPLAGLLAMYLVMLRIGACCTDVDIFFAKVL